MREFKFFKGYVYLGEIDLPMVRRMVGRTIANELVPVQPLGSPDNDFHILRNSLYGALRIRECAVISASIRDFNLWKRQNFDLNNVNMVTSGEFLHTNVNYNVTTRYRAITHVHECRGLFFDDYTKTDRTNELLNHTHDEYMVNHIRQVIVEVRLHTRQENNI